MLEISAETLRYRASKGPRDRGVKIEAASLSSTNTRPANGLHQERVGLDIESQTRLTRAPGR